MKNIIEFAVKVALIALLLWIVWCCKDVLFGIGYAAVLS